MIHRTYRQCSCQACAAAASLPSVSVANPGPLRSTPHHWPQVGAYPSKTEKDLAMRPAWPQAPSA